MKQSKYSNVEEYAAHILSEHGCDEFTYGGESGETVLSDLKAAYPAGMEYSYIEVANAIISMSKVKPIVRAPYIMRFDTDSFTDGIDEFSLEAAKMDALDTLLQWMAEEVQTWKDAFCPTDEELDNYNYMICNSSVSVCAYNPDTDEYDEIWYPSYEDEEKIGWRELTQEDMREIRETVQK